MSPSRADLACFSYLAQVQTHHVDAYPRINYGTEILHTERFLAGDGPIVAGVARSLGLDATLASNAVGDDHAGLDVTDRLTGWGVPHAPAGPGRTRTNIVVCDAAGNRTWLSDLHGIAADLAHVDLEPVITARLVYVDCYEVLGTAPQRVVEAALDTGAGVVLNLGGSPPLVWLTNRRWPRRALAVQINIDEHRWNQAGALAADVAGLNFADLVVVTGGRHGAIARTRTGTVAQSAAVPVPVRHAQGAGAAFSAALLHAILAGSNVPECLRLACATGSLWCSQPVGAPLPTVATVTQLVSRAGGQRQPIPGAASRPVRARPASP